MKFKDYIELKIEAEEAGVNSPALGELLHILQAKDIAICHHIRYLREMSEWERNLADEVKAQIREARSETAGEQE